MSRSEQKEGLTLKITYCVECDYLPLATALGQAIEAEFGLVAELVEGSGGIFAVRLDDRTIYNNLDQGGQLPTEAQILQMLAQQLARPAGSTWRPRKIQAFNPMGFPPTIEPVRMAPRLETLAGKTVYLVDARFDDSDRLLMQMQRWFAEHLPDTKTRLVSKSGVYTEDDPALFEEISSQGDAMLMAVGH